MSGTTIGSYMSVGLTLSSPGQMPVTVTGTGTITTAAGYAAGIYAAANLPATISNGGQISASEGYGVRLGDGERW